VNIGFNRWHSAIAHIPRRSAALGIAGLAIVGVALAGPATGALATATPVAAVVKATATAAPTPLEKALSPDFQFQPNYYYCGPAAVRLALTADGHASPSMDELASLLGTTTYGTNSAEDTTRVLNEVLGAAIYQTRAIPGISATPAETDLLRVDVVRSISNGHAVVANVAGYTTDLNGGFHSYPGHYLTVVGYGQGGTTMKIADPADTQGTGYYWISTVNLANWIGSHGYSTA
jgi:hypothetical protein